MLVVLAFWDRKRLGNRWAIGVALSTSILGVCLGLAFYAVGLSRPKEVETA
jgi:hypothetical protein